MTSNNNPEFEKHYVNCSSLQRAKVLGINDGILSTVSIGVTVALAMLQVNMFQLDYKQILKKLI